MQEKRVIVDFEPFGHEQSQHRLHKSLKVFEKINDIELAAQSAEASGL